MTNDWLCIHESRSYLCGPPTAYKSSINHTKDQIPWEGKTNHHLKYTQPLHNLSLVSSYTKSHFNFLICSSLTDKTQFYISMADQLLNLNIIFEHKARTITYTIKKQQDWITISPTALEQPCLFPCPYANIMQISRYVNAMLTYSSLTDITN